MLIKRTVIPFLVLMVSVAAFTAGCFGKTDKDTNTPSAIGIIDMNKAIQAHPKYQQLVLLKQQLNTISAQIDAEKVKAARQFSSMSSVITSPDNTALNTAFEQEFKEKMAGEQAELNAKLSAKADQARGKLTDELKAYTAEVDKEYHPQIFSIQLKLKTVQLSKEEMTDLQNQLEQLQKSRNNKLADKERQLAAKMDAIMGPEQKAVEQQLAAYASQLNNELAQKAAAKSAAIEARNKSQALQPASSAVIVNPELEQQLGMKRQEVTVLEQFIIQDVRDKAAKIAAEGRLDSVITNIQVNVNATDITESVIAEFKK
ncbi:molecular chaperone Skp [Dendrosporobacter sp. 1207_IL3150]|uniref:molecular chaperone Skp n=1 Tax=Dendrosporobacter sp. 1207_IL3150 TaxID=3084054 RepID=UPI002FDB1907